ncbi:MAG: 23S rRNA (adenine(2030)-N(6))-methyltransferase RlmJ [Pseudomonadota bacterium]|nr:23S rRNA (adenine(2030)-N(6))-methyltransferase RlmJ [Pseudomonadota bacterium]
MLSYRHAFHAGNHADVLKHAVLIALLDYLNQKDKPWWYIDTHAGAGIYDLHGDYARKTGELDSGIARLWDRTDLPPMLASYVELVRGLNPDGRLRLYPGSPWCALQRARAEDRLRLFELHSSDHRLLSSTFSESGRQVRIEGTDGHAGLKSVLPPPTRRGLVLIDPSYEVKSDYPRTVEALKDGLTRFVGGTYMVWYPLLQKPDARQLPSRLKAARPPGWLNVTLTVHAPLKDGFGMHGSGLYIANPPWTLPAMLEATLPWLVQALGQDAGAGYTLEHEIP